MTLRLVCLLSALCAPWTARALDFGDRAPSLSGIRTWIGEPFDPAQPDGRTVSVIEFWATAYPPSRVTVPHLNELQKRFGGRHVVIVGVTVEPEDTVRRFLQDHPAHYRIALDADEAVTRAYLEGIDVIPYAFLVDSAGGVVWHGHPLAGLEAALDDLLEGRLDPERERVRQQRESALLEALQRGDGKRISALLDEMIEADPGNLELYQMKAGVLMQLGDAPGLAAHFERMAEAFRNSAPDLNNIAWMIAAPSPLPLPQRNLRLAWRTALRADEMTGGREASVLETLAMVYYAAGRPEKAAETQARAVAMAGDPEQEREMNAMLEFYRGLLDLRREMEAAETAPPSPTDS